AIALEPGTRVTDKVTLTHPLGEGAMGAVWVARHATLETDVAVKFVAEDVIRIRPEAAQRFTREARAAAQIKSPHVVQMIDHGVMGNETAYIVMELLHGETLHDYLEREGRMSPEDTSLLVTQVARALSVAHDRGVVHRDIKPHNIFLLDSHDELFVKVLDFGIAKRLTLNEELTEPGTIVGTPQYVSRDLIMAGDQKTIDEKVDLWSMAIVAYKCLTGELPYDGDTIGKVCAAIANGQFVPPSELVPDLDPRFDAWFARALAPEPADRFATADEVARTFREVLEPPAEEPAPSASGDRRRMDRKLPVVIGIGLAVGVAIGVHGYGQRPDEAVDVPASTSAPPASGSAATSPSPSSLPTPSGAPGPSARVATAPSALPSASASASPSLSAAPSASASPSASAAPSAPIAIPDAMLLVPAGRLWMGCHRNPDLECEADEIPGHEVELPAFLIDRTEVRVVDYAECVISGECSERRLEGYSIDGGAFVPSTKCNWKQPGRERHPLNCVSHVQAASFCAWRSARLPTEAEWERAARGDDQRRYPWGDAPANCTITVMADEGDQGCGKGGTWPVGHKPKDVSPFGVLDMGGNVREWVADWYDPAYYKKKVRDAPQGPETGTRRVTRGGSWSNVVSRFLRVSRRESHEPGTRNMYLGFRCARDLPTTAP
ncbi:MAG: bifunctional serine/threonine-protein kinase/formylglycine-generating enzyme family protein, partial [Polyangiaceae bacterium]